MELRIFSDNEDGPQDVTFAYNANFFLYATLEFDRPMAHGRGQPPIPPVPVLTGMPVSGMAYLDRPTEAGYFIFPDLSVRHEGRYKLLFNLYEEIKDTKDADVEMPKELTKPKPPSVQGPEPDSSYDWRMEVKSKPFTVYSAKKFPGLAESTSLSRTVAEQGCRVRIRRDVRMRKRDSKDAAETVEAGDEEYVRPGRAKTPTGGGYRRAGDYAAGRHDVQPAADQSRRQSIDYSVQAYPQPNTPSCSSSHSSAAPSGYSSHGSSNTQYQAPPQYVQQQPPQVYQQHNGYQHVSQYRHQSTAPNYGFDRSPYPPTPTTERDGFDFEHRRSSVGYAPPQYPRRHQYDPVDAYGRSASANYHVYQQKPQSPSMRSPVDLPPMKGSNCDNLPSPSGPLAPVSRIVSYEKAPPGYNYHNPTNPQPQSDNSRSNTNKRSFDSVFHSSSNTQPLHNGQRPSSSHAANTFFDEEEDEICLDHLKMQYKRADGSNHSRALPSVN